MTDLPPLRHLAPAPMVELEYQIALVAGPYLTHLVGQCLLRSVHRSVGDRITRGRSWAIAHEIRRRIRRRIAANVRRAYAHDHASANLSDNILHEVEEEVEAWDEMVRFDEPPDDYGAVIF